MSKKIKLLCLGILTTILFVLSLPLVLETSFGNKMLVSWISGEVPGTFSVEKIHLSWFKGQELQDIHYKNLDGTLSLHIKSIEVDASLPSLIFNRGNFKDAIVTGLDAEMAEDTSRKITLRDGRLTASMKNLSILSLQGDARLITSQGEERFSVDGEIPLIPNESTFTTARFSITNLPSALIDGYLSITQKTESRLARGLFGKQLTISLKEAEGSLFLLEVESENLKGGAHFKMESGTFVSDGNSALTFTLTPQLMNASFALKSQEPIFTLKNNPLATLEVLNFKAHPKGSFEKISCDLSLNIKNAEVSLLNSPLSFAIKSLNQVVQLRDGSVKSKTTLSAKNLLSGEDIALTSDAFVKNIFNRKGKLAPESLELDLTARHFPLSLFQRADFLGKSANVRFSGKYSKEEGRFLLSFLSDNVQLENVQVVVGDEISLQKPASVHINLHPEALASLFNNSSLRIEGESLKIDGIIEKLTLPKLSKSRPFDFTKFQDAAALKFTASAQGPIVLTVEDQGALVDSIKLDFEKKKNSPTTFEALLKLTPKLKAPYQEIANESFQLMAKGKALIDHDDNLILKDTLIKGESTNHQLDALVNLNDGALQLITPASIKLKITPSAINGLAFSKSGSFNLKKPTQVNISLTPFDYPIHLSDLQRMNLTGHINMDVLDFFSYGNEFILKDLAVPFEFIADEKRFKLSPTLKTLSPKFNKEGLIAGKISLKGWDSLLSGSLEGVTFKSRMQLMDFPTEILALHLPVNIRGFLGPIVSLDLDAQYEKQLKVQASIQGKDLQGTLSLFTDENLAVKSEETFAELDFTLNQDIFNALVALAKEENPEPHYTLLENSKARLKISSVHFSSERALYNMGFALDLHIDKFLLNDLKRKQTIRLSNVSALVNTENLRERLSLKIEALPENGDRAKGSLHINSVISNIFTKEGKWNSEEAGIDAKATAISFKTAAFCDLFCPYPTIAGKLDALLGSTLDADIRLQITKMTGPVFASIRGGNGSMKMNGNLKGGFLHLGEPLVAEVKATPALGKHIFSEIAPFLQGLESSSSPIRFTIYNEGFAFPVKNYDTAAIAIKEASLETGKMVFSNSPEITALISLLNGQQKEKHTVWLTPIYFSLKEGKIKLKRADMLVSDAYHFASWGIVDLLNERVDMMIGVAGGTLTKALNIPKLKNDAMLQIPFKGPLSNPKIDKTKAAAKISSLVASNQGPEGMILGTFIDIASGGFLDQDAPSPTTTPFPWGDIADAGAEAAPRKDKKKESPLEKAVTVPLDEIEKGGKKLLKKLFQ